MKINKTITLYALGMAIPAMAQTNPSGDIEVSANVVSGCYIDPIPNISFTNPQLMTSSSFGLAYLAQDYAYFDFNHACTKGTPFSISVEKETFQFPLKSAFAPLLRHTTNTTEYPIAVYLFNSRTKIDATTILPMHSDLSQKPYVGNGKKENIPMTLVLGNTNYFYGYKYQYIKGDYTADIKLNIFY